MLSLQCTAAHRWRELHVGTLARVFTEGLGNTIQHTQVEVMGPQEEPKAQAASAASCSVRPAPSLPPPAPVFSLSQFSCVF